MSTSNLTEAPALPHPKMMRDVKFYFGRVDTRWHVYPQEEPLEIIAHDWSGFWALSPQGEWFKSPVSYVFQREITREEAEAGRAALKGGAK